MEAVGEEHEAAAEKVLEERIKQTNCHFEKCILLVTKLCSFIYFILLGFE